MSRVHELDPSSGSSRSSRASLARGLGRAVGVVVGVGIGLYGLTFYVLRCFSTCPSDPAENAISQILTLSLLGFGVIVVIAAASLGTRSGAVGSWMITLLGGLMALGGVVTLVLAPSLRLAGDRTGTIMLGLLDLVAGAGVVLFGTWARSRNRA